MLNDEPPVTVGETVHPSPFHPRNLFDLFFRPRRFFTNLPLMQHKPHLYIAAWLYGVACSLTFAHRMTLGSFSLGESVGIFESILYSWIVFILIAMISGGVIAILAWFVIGSIYWFLIVFSQKYGYAKYEPDGFVIRQILFYPESVFAVPMLFIYITALLYATYSDIVYPTSEITPLEPMGQFATIFFFGTVWGIALLISSWVVFARYIGVRTCFPTVRWLTLVFFVGPHVVQMFIFISTNWAW